MPAVAVLVLSAAVVASVLLWQWVDGLAFVDPDKKSAAHLDVLKLAASIAVGGGGLFALYLAARRQRTQELELEQRKRELMQRERVQAHAEQVAEHNQQDAAARRVTELYSKSVEQMGSDKAAVRLGGMYALERLAQDNPEQRPTAVSVFCAYLRMPFEPPDTPPQPDDPDTDYKTALAEHRERVQEREVRVAAQRILRDHLRTRPEEQSPVTYWPDTDLDLTNAHLIDFDLSQCNMRLAVFGLATFTGPADFRWATFTSSANFDGATFTGLANFRTATFTDDASFTSATFTGYAAFRSATFTGDTDFGAATFTGHTDFERVTFTGVAGFGSATFTSNANFRWATFTLLAHFASATFTGLAGFRSATISAANFWSATFNHGVPPEVAGFISPPE